MEQCYFTKGYNSLANLKTEKVMRTIDLTHLITDYMPVYPGTETPHIKSIAAHQTHGYLEHLVRMTTHTGTHVDAPAHMIENGKTLDQMSTNDFCGTAMSISFTDKNENNREICIEDLVPFETDISEHEFVILNTGWYKHWGESKYFENYPSLTAEAASWLSEFNLKGIGVDVISIDAHDAIDFPVHNILLETGMILIENLTNLHSLPDSLFWLSCMPLKIMNSDGSPVRAVAFSYE